MTLSIKLPPVPEYQKTIIEEMGSFIHKHTYQCSSLTQRILASSPESHIGLTKDGRTVRWMENTQKTFSILTGSIGMTICQPATLIPITKMVVLWQSYKYINPAITTGSLFLYENINAILNNNLTENAKLAVKITALCIASQYINPLIIDLATLVFKYCIQPALDPDNAATDPAAQAQNIAEPSLTVQNVIAKCTIISAAIGLGAGVIVSGTVIPPLAGSVNLIEYLVRKWRPTSEDNEIADNYTNENNLSAEDANIINQIRNKLPLLNIDDDTLLQLSKLFTYDMAHKHCMARLYGLDDKSVQLIASIRMKNCGKWIIPSLEKMHPN